MSARRAGIILRLITGWVLGFLLAAPYLLPVLDYSRDGSRLARRGAGEEERPPVGLRALPQVVLPDMYGAKKKDSLRFTMDHHAESSAAGYAGVLATLLAAPLAFCSRRHRGINLFWILLAFFGLAWCLNAPGLVSLLRLPGLNMMSHNRLVFLTAFAILALAVTGLDALLADEIRWRWWFWVPSAALLTLCAWCIYRTIRLPQPVRTQLTGMVLAGKEFDWIHDVSDVVRVQNSLARYYTEAAVGCGVALLGWFVLKAGWRRPSRLLPFAGGLMLADLVWFAHGRNVQCDRALYFPPVPVLESVAKAGPGRMIGFGCLPAALSAMCGLRDVRGHDAVDPSRMVELVLRTADSASTVSPEARTMQIAPKAIITPPGDIRISPALDMLGVRYVILRGSPPTNAAPVFRGLDYWVLQNPAAMERVFVPQRTELVTDATERVQKLTAPRFNPREVALVETPVDLPNTAHGSANVVDEVPTRVRIAAQMETQGLVVLADRWDRGWKCFLDGKAVPILVVNHVLRGIVVSAGKHQLEFRYWPASFAWGLKLAGMAAAVLVIWMVVLRSGCARLGHRNAR